MVQGLGLGMYKWSLLLLLWDSYVSSTVGKPDLANQKTRHPVKFDFQIDKNHFFKCKYVSNITWNILIHITYLKFKFKWASCILSGKITSLLKGRLGYGKVNLQGIKLWLNLIFHLLILGRPISPKTLSIFSCK